jgi:hypothetical protein
MVILIVTKQTGGVNNMAANNQTSRNRALIPEAQSGLDQFKHEIANEIGVQIPSTGYWGNMTSRDCGSVGGFMVKRMVESYEKSLAGRSGGTNTF